MKLLPNGNVEITVQLLPHAYAAMKEASDRDGLSDVNLINAGVVLFNEVSKMGKAMGKPLGDDTKWPDA